MSFNRETIPEPVIRVEAFSFQLIFPRLRPIPSCRIHTELGKPLIDPTE